jgi:hypothetical protein
MPTIALIDKTRQARHWGIEREALCETLQIFIDRHLAPVWGTSCHVVLADDFDPESWVMAFFDEPDAMGALGYHDLTPGGLPLAKIAVGAVLRRGKLVSMIASHELAEMLVDPDADTTVPAFDDETQIALEICDPVGEDGFSIGGAKVTNFVYPAWFGPAVGQRHVDPTGKLDHLGHTSRPLQILPRGYVLARRKGTWTKLRAVPERGGR